jgi:hypothetical protein
VEKLNENAGLLTMSVSVSLLESPVPRANGATASPTMGITSKIALEWVDRGSLLERILWALLRGMLLPKRRRHVELWRGSRAVPRIHLGFERGRRQAMRSETTMATVNDRE